MKYEISIEEIRNFCMETLLIAGEYYSYINVENEKRLNKYFERCRKDADRWFTKVMFIFSFIFKAIMVALGRGHLVDFETFRAYKERIASGKGAFLDYGLYAKELGDMMPAAIQNTMEAIRTNDEALDRYYRALYDDIDCQDQLKPVVKGILNCNVNLPFKSEDWDRWFSITANVVSKDPPDMPNFTYFSRLQAAFATHKQRRIELC